MYRRVLGHFGLLTDDRTHLLLWGCSATVLRHDGLKLGTVFDEVTYYRDIREMIREGWYDTDFGGSTSHCEDYTCTCTLLTQALQRTRYLGFYRGRSDKSFVAPWRL